MPTVDEHKRQADANKSFFADIAKEFNSKYFDWKITTLFYEIVHCAEQFAAKNGVHHRRHKDREDFLYKTLDSDDYNLYRQLKNAGRRSRYDVKDLTSASRAYCIQIYNNSYAPLRQAFDNRYNK